MGHAAACEGPKQVLAILCTKEMVHQHQFKGGKLWAVGLGQVLAVETFCQYVTDFVDYDELAPQLL